jgi:hypothetical protein
MYCGGTEVRMRDFLSRARASQEGRSVVTVMLVLRVGPQALLCGMIWFVVEGGGTEELYERKSIPSSER